MRQPVRTRRRPSTTLRRLPPSAAAARSVSFVIIQKDATDMAKNSKKAKKRGDKRKAMLIYMKPDIIAQLKAAAQAVDQRAWQFVEEAVKRALKSRKTSRRP